VTLVFRRRTQIFLLTYLLTYVMLIVAVRFFETLMIRSYNIAIYYRLLIYSNFVIWSNVLDENGFGIFNPLMGTGNYSAISNNMKLVHWPLMCGLLRLVQRREDWAGLQPAQAPACRTKRNSPLINGQCTNHCIMVRCSVVLMCPLMG